MLAGLPRLGARVSIGAFAGTVLAMIAAALVPTFSVENPQRVNVVFRQDDDRARVFVDTSWGRATLGKAPRAMSDAVGATSERAPALPWTPPATFAEAPRSSPCTCRRGPLRR